MPTFSSPQFSDLVRARAQGKEKRVPWFLHDKMKCYEFSKMIGVDVAEIFNRFDSAEDIDLSILPDEFVLKPTYMFSSIGVMVLKRVSGDKYEEFMHGGFFSAEEIVEYQRKIAAKKADRDSKPVIAEERIKEADGRNVPRDLKFFGFQGEIAFIQQVGNGHKKPTHAWFDGDFNPLDSGQIKSDPQYFDIVEPERPDNWQEQLNMARRVSVAVPAPFARIDTYSADRGPLLGEVTLVPGVIALEGYVDISDEIESNAARAWRDAEARLHRSR